MVRQQTIRNRRQLVEDRLIEIIFIRFMWMILYSRKIYEKKNTHTENWIAKRRSSQGGLTGKKPITLASKTPGQELTVLTADFCWDGPRMVLGLKGSVRVRVTCKVKKKVYSNSTENQKKSL